LTLTLGYLTIPNNATVEISLNGHLNISGCASLGGSLVINLQYQPLMSSKPIVPISAACFVANATFQNITAINVNKCQRVTSTSSLIKVNDLDIIFGFEDVCEHSPPDLIIGIVFGVVVGIAIIFTILILAFPSLRYKILPLSQKKVDKVMTLS